MVNMKIVKETLNEAIGLAKFEPFIITKKVTSKGETIYKFTEKNPGFEGKLSGGEPIVYTYSMEKGNIYYKNPDKWATQSLTGGSPGFHKNNPAKMPVINDLKKATEIITKHYFNYKPIPNDEFRRRMNRY